MRRQIETTQRMMRMLELIVDGTGTAALSGPASNQATLTDNGTGDYTVTFAQPFGNTPVVVATPETANVAARIVTKSATAVQINTRGDLPETTASITQQGVTLYSLLPGQIGMGIQYEKTAGATAGNEVVTVTGTVISVQVESGVSTATQVVAKLIASDAARNLVSAVATTGATAQTALVATALTGGQGATSGGLVDADFHLLVIGSEVAEKY